MMEGGLEEAIALGRMADQYQVEAVQAAVEDALVRMLTVENSWRVLAWVYRSGLARVGRASRGLALHEFDGFTGRA